MQFVTLSRQNCAIMTRKREVISITQWSSRKFFKNGFRKIIELTRLTREGKNAFLSIYGMRFVNVL
jgi:heme-degrading monooxygenase HmoA